MINTSDNTQIPVPRPKSGASISMVWLIPLVTLVIGGWLVYRTISEQGPKIEISFKTAEGIEAGKTKIKYKDIEIGRVDEIRFSADASKVILNVSMNQGTASFLGRGTRFWVVKPRLTLRGATGLETLLSGSFIEIEPGKGDIQTRFEGLDTPPVVKADVSGSKFMLSADSLNSIDRGSPIYYQGIPAGEVLGWELGNDRKSIFIHAFVKAPYDRLVKSNTRFWNISGINLTMGADGVEFKTASLSSLLYGGIAFETPLSDRFVDGEITDQVSGLVFTLYEDYAAIQAADFIKKATCVMFFDGSVRGLKPGAPVEFKGIKVGQVKDLRLVYDRKNQAFQIPVLVEIEPERFLTDSDMTDISPIQALQDMIDDGLRARLQTSSLLTGLLFVQLDIYPGTPVNMTSATLPYPQIPTIPAQLNEMTASVKNILDNLENLDLKGINQRLNQALEGVTQVVNKTDALLDTDTLSSAVADAAESLGLLRQILSQVDQRMAPMADHIEKALTAGYAALEKTRKALDAVNQTLEPNAPLQYHIIELSSELTQTARSIRVLVDMLERSPDAVIFGKHPQNIQDATAR